MQCNITLTCHASEVGEEPLVFGFRPYLTVFKMQQEKAKLQKQVDRSVAAGYLSPIPQSHSVPLVYPPATGAVIFQSSADLMEFMNAVVSLGMDISSIKEMHFASGLSLGPLGMLVTSFFLLYSTDMKITILKIDQAEALFDVLPHLANAFVLLTTVKHLTLHGIGKHARRMLCNIRSMLVSADLTMIPFEDPDCDSSMLEAEVDKDSRTLTRSPIDLLWRSRASLESLKGSGCETLCDTEGIWYSSRYYPQVRVIDLRENDIPVTIHYVRAFPTLSKLSIATSHEILSSLDITSWNAMVKVRKRNQVEQRQFGTWRALETCCAPLIDHFMLNIMCPVTEVEIVGPYMDLDMLLHVLRTSRPTSLVLKGFLAGEIFTPRFAKLLRQPCVAQLSHLQMNLLTRGCDITDILVGDFQLHCPHTQ